MEKLLNSRSVRELIKKNPLYGTHKVEGESLTVPDQSLTVRQIMSNMVIGRMEQIAKKIYYDGEDVTHDDVNPMLDPDYDLSDITRLEGELTQLKAVIKEKDEKAKLAEREKTETLKKAKEDEKALASSETEAKPQNQEKQVKTP